MHSQLKKGFFLVNNDNYRPDKQPQYYLSNSPLNYLPLSRAQKTVINKAIPYRVNPEQFLSPNQINWLNNNQLQFKVDASTYMKNIEDAWEVLCEIDEFLIKTIRDKY